MTRRTDSGRLVATLVWLALASSATPIGTAFTYQGHLTSAGTPATALYDMRFTLYSAAAGGDASAPVAIPNVQTTAGDFTVSLDFGPGAFAGNKRWLEIGVRPAGSPAPHTILNPRQELTPSPNSLYAAKAGDAASIAGLACNDAEVLKWNGTAWSCGHDANNGGTVTAIVAGSGLSGGLISTEGTIAVAPLGITGAMVANGAIGSSKIANGAVGAAQINQAEVQTRVTAMCPIGQYLRGVTGTGGAVCESLNRPTSLVVVDDPPGSSAGSHSSIKLGTDGFPVISYQGAEPGQPSNLKVAKCVNATCAGTSVITTVDPASSVGSYTSLAIGADGFPVISYIGGGSLKVAKCANAACTGVSSITVVGSGTAFTSIAIGADGLPIISYREGSALKVAKCVAPSCSGTSTITTVDAMGGSYPNSIAIGTDGLPVMSYGESVNYSLKVAKCLNPDCSGTITINTVDDPANVLADGSSIAVGPDGLPVISYIDQSASHVKVAKCVTADCSGVSTRTVVTTSTSGGPTSIAVGPDNIPAIAYADVFSRLRLAKCANAACTGAATITQVDADTQVVWFSSIALVLDPDGFPAISYNSATLNALLVARCYKPTCAP